MKIKWCKKLLMVCGLAFIATQANAQVSNYRKLPDVQYGKDKENTLDAYLPNAYENAKVIVYLHGSGWTGGDKNELPKVMIEELVAKRNYIVISANYRLVKDGKNRFPAQMEDVKNLFAFLSDHADQYHYNGKEFALMGGSAGAHLAMLYAYGYDPAKQVKTVVDFWGPTDLTDKAVRENDPVGNAKVVNLLGDADPKAKIGFDASPYFRLSKETGVPTLIFHGGQDPLVPVSQAEKLHKKLQALDIPVQYEYYPDEKHGMKGPAAFDVLSKTLAWIDKYYGTAAVQPLPALAKLPKSKNGFVVISHRGSHLVKPENTIAAIEEAIKFGADYVEIDLRTTKDGQLVLCHNETVDGRSNGKGRVRDLTRAEIARLELTGKDGKIYRIPDFKEVLKACKNKINIYLDFKDADVAQTYAQIQAEGMEAGILVYANKLEQYKAWRQLAPKMPVISGLPASIKTREELLSALRIMPLEATDNVKDPVLLTALKEFGVAVFLDVQNAEEGPEQWQAAMNKDIQGVQTDHPEALIRYLKENQLRNGKNGAKIQEQRK